jgi:SAM-dependent methyltransferase
MTATTEAIYDGASRSWRRAAPVLLSDYTARPFLLDWCDSVERSTVLDLGCGEGYFARQLKQRGAAHIEGLDLSSEMIARALEQEREEPLGIRYATGHATDLGRFEDASFDLVVAVFLFNYLDHAETTRTMCEVARVLRPGGRFIFAVPHPSLAFQRPEEPPFYFSRDEAGYFSGRDRVFEGEIWRRDGECVPVRCVHKTFSDYFTALRQAGFLGLPEIEELHVTESIRSVDPAFFGPLVDQPLHLAFRVEKPV